MDVKLAPGKYVVAVSGGVDSMVLLHLLTTTYHLSSTTHQFVVAHFDHGIREDSARDRKLVEETAKKLRLQFVHSDGKLGADASEAQAREARYEFLRKVVNDKKAKAIVTAHHQDDAVETLIINMLRGTSRRGVLKETEEIKRPLLKVPKEEILKYAAANNLKWREDSTNKDTKYLRNYVRLKLLPEMKQADPDVMNKLLNSNTSLLEANREIDEEIVKILESNCQVSAKKIVISRQWLIMLPNDVGREILYDCARKLNPNVEMDRKNIENLLIFVKTAKVNKRAPLNGRINVHTEAAKIIMELV